MKIYRKQRVDYTPFFTSINLCFRQEAEIERPDINLQFINEPLQQVEDNRNIITIEEMTFPQVIIQMFVVPTLIFIAFVLNFFLRIIRGRFTPKDLLIMIAVAYLTTKATYATGLKIKGNYKACDLNKRNQAIWDIPESCSYLNETANLPSQRYFILKEKEYPYGGIAYHCQMKFISIHVSMNFLGLINRETIEEWVPLDMVQCIEMKQKHICADSRNKLSCNQDSCIYPIKKKTKNDYIAAWMHTKTYHEVECELRQDTVSSSSLESHVYVTNQKEHHSCKISDFKCPTRTGIMIWSEDIVHRCPYEFVQTAYLTRQNNILLNIEEKKLYQIIDEKTICNHTRTYRTSQGFFITQDDAVVLLPQATVDSKLINGFLVSEFDFQSNSLFMQMNKIVLTSNERLCQLFRAFANLYTRLDNEYFLFNDFNGNEAVLYASKGKIFVPDCAYVSNLKIVNKTKFCYKDLPVEIRFDNKTSRAFLTQDKIVIKHSKQVACETVVQLIHLKHIKKVILRKKTTTKILNDDTFMDLKFNLEIENMTALNFKHHHDIIRGTRSRSQENKITLNDEGFSITDVTETINKADVNEKFSILDHKFNYFKRITALLIIIVLLVTILSLITIKKICCL